jgi:hypothetical protein
VAAPDPSPLWQFASSVISFLAGFASAVFAEPLRQKIFRPGIQLSFSGADDCITRTPTSGAGTATYIRVKVTSSKRRSAKGCRAFLVGIETKSSGGKFAPTEFVDSLPLAWSCSPPGTERTPRDLLWGVNQYIDVVAVLDSRNYLEPQFAPIPHRYISIFSATEQIYRFTILVSGDGVQPSQLCLVITWKGDAKKMDVYEDAA